MSKQILLVDDEESIRDLLSMRLKSAGYEIETVDNGTGALEKARTTSPDLIILDIMLPGLDGYKVCQMLKFDENYKEIPIILLSAKDQESDIALGFQTGANAYISKSSDNLWDTLKSKIEELL